LGKKLDTAMAAAFSAPLQDKENSKVNAQPISSSTTQNTTGKRNQGKHVNQLQALFFLYTDKQIATFAIYIISKLILIYYFIYVIVSLMCHYILGVAVKPADQVRQHKFLQSSKSKRETLQAKFRT
jgi:hypothetical protein